MGVKPEKQRGFNLLELMIVIAVIALLISLGGYAWQVMILRGNETAAISHINKIQTAQAYYASKHKGRLAASFRQLVNENLLSKSFDSESPRVDGYKFILQAEPDLPRFYSVNADPEVDTGLSATGRTHYYLDSASHTITATEAARPAKPEDPPL